MNRKVITFVLIAFAGVALAFAVVPLLGRTTAIASPASYNDVFRAIGSIELANLVWNFAVVGLLGAGIAVFLACLLALWVARTSRFATIATFVAGFFVGGHVLTPIYFGQAEYITAVLFGRSWWGYGIELSVLCSAAAAALVHLRLSRRRSGL
ncbi:MAG: hypothetical protein HC814_02675 [Rhodobacteraceae bacterium]|nr:hypothetical protein [Paracoccaceae bacterium]